MDGPRTGLLFGRQPHALQVLQASDQNLPLTLQPGFGEAFDTHQAIVAGLPLQHDPRTRRCALSSVTSFARVGDVWREVSYAEPAATGGAVDVGAV